jgi:hypothetical protein
METYNKHKNKVQKNKLTITKSDKGKTLVVLSQEEYEHKIDNIIRDKHFITINNNPTQQYHKIVKQTLK